MFLCVENMSITTKDVNNISKLANIKLSDSEVEFIAGELDSIMHWIDQLKNLDVSDVDLHESSEMILPERNDEVTESSNVEAILSNAPDKVESWFAVPKIIE